MRSFVPVSFLNINKIPEANTVPLCMVGLFSGVSMHRMKKNLLKEWSWKSSLTRMPRSWTKLLRKNEALGAGKHLQEKCTKISVPTGGEKENRETEYGGRTDNPGFPFKTCFLVFLLGKRYPEKVILRRLGQVLRKYGCPRPGSEGGPDQLMAIPFRKKYPEKVILRRLGPSNLP